MTTGNLQGPYSSGTSVGYAPTQMIPISSSGTLGYPGPQQAWYQPQQLYQQPMQQVIHS